MLNNPKVLNLHFPNHVMWTNKALNGLKQASRALYKHLTTFLLVNGFQRRGGEKALFFVRNKDEVVVV